MKEFLEPEIEIIPLKVSDVIATSFPGDGEDDAGWA